MKKISEQALYRGQWLDLYELTYRDEKTGTLLKWETVRRKKSAPCGVVVIAKLIPSQRFILIRQFRPAIEGFIVSFPAGLANGDPQHALVELKEETGYTGRVVSASPPLKVGSSIIDDSGRIIYVEVDEHDPANSHPQQQLEPGEVIEVLLLRPSEGREFLESEYQKGIYISSNLWYLFISSEEVGKNQQGLKFLRQG